MVLHDIYNPDGLLKQKFASYQVREGQVKMSQLVEQAIRDRKSAVIEGATGVGKGFAYLIPAILSGQQIIVSTSNKSLQDQLDKQDLPALQNILGTPLSWAVLKGKSNYFCREKFRSNEMEITVELMGDSGTEQDVNEAKVRMQQILDWVAEETIGDIEYCPLELPRKVRELICCDNHTVHEKDSEGFTGCCAAQARMRAKQSRIILVNHTLLALDMDLRRTSEGKIGFLPEGDTIIIDEAHEFEKAAILAFSDEITIYSLFHLLNRAFVKRVLAKKERNALIDTLQHVLQSYLPEKTYNNYYTEKRVATFDGLGPVIDGLQRVISILAQNNTNSADTAMVGQLTKEAETLQDRLRELVTPNDNMLRWSEAKDNSKGEPVVKLKTVPLDVSPLIQEGLFGNGKSVIACSATLSVFGSFSYFKEQVGMPLDSLELIVPSPFNFKEQALIYISDGSQDKYYEMEQLLAMSQGRAFILFCSYKDMREAYQYVKTPHPKLMQSYDVPRAQLLDEFKQTPHAVLFATKSFWEGVDVKGEQLSLVILHKIPFEVPSNLIFQAKCEKIDAKYGARKSFIKLAIPEACLRLKQGAGRLIRSSEDKGVVALLDPRVNDKPYGRMVIESLPDGYRTQQLAKVASFFERINQ